LAAGLRQRLLGVSLLALTACSSTEQKEAQPQRSAPQEARVPFMLAHVYYKDSSEVGRLALEFDLMEYANDEEGYVDALLSWKQYEDLLARGYRVEINEEQTALLNQKRQMLVSGNSISGYSCFRTVEETDAAMAALAASKPNIAEWKDIGDSWDKQTVGGPAGYDLRVMKLTNKATSGTKPKLFIVGSVHAREYAPAELATRFAETLANEYGTNADTTWLLDRYEVHIMPHGNPDGRKMAEAGQLHRKNTNTSQASGCPTTVGADNRHYGVDLNRNHSFKWGVAGASTDACEQLYRGASVGSEPEVQAIQNYVRTLFPDQRGGLDTDAASLETTGLLISLHSYGKLVIYPWGHSVSTTAPNHTELLRLGRKLGFFNGYTVCRAPEQNCLKYETSGSTEDWVYGELGVPGILMEVGDAFFESCSNFDANILPQNRAALRFALKAARRPYRDIAGPEVTGVTLSASTVTAGSWVTVSATASDGRFALGEGVQNVVAGRYSFINPPFAGGSSFAMAASDGSFNSSTEGVFASFNTGGWPAGRYLVYVEAQDANGNWGVPSATFLTVQ
jgi:hypothetical protein